MPIATARQRRPGSLSKRVAVVEPSGPLPWPKREVIELSDQRLALVIPEGGSFTRINEIVSLPAARAEAMAILAGSTSGTPTLLFRLALALVALDARCGRATDLPMREPEAVP